MYVFTDNYINLIELIWINFSKLLLFIDHSTQLIRSFFFVEDAPNPFVQEKKNLHLCICGRQLASVICGRVTSLWTRKFYFFCRANYDPCVNMVSCKNTHHTESLQRFVCQRHGRLSLNVGFFFVLENSLQSEACWFWGHALTAGFSTVIASLFKQLTFLWNLLGYWIKTSTNNGEYRSILLQTLENAV